MAESDPSDTSTSRDDTLEVIGPRGTLYTLDDFAREGDRLELREDFDDPDSPVVCVGTVRFRDGEWVVE